MTLDRIEKFNNELASMLQQYQSVAQEQDKLNGMVQLAISIDDRERGAKITEMLIQNAPMLDGIAKAVCEKTNAADVQRAVTVYTDIGIRIENANKLFDAWRRTLANYELAVAAGKITDENREQANADVTEAKALYDLAVEQADLYVPNKATLLGITPSGLL